MSLKWNASEGDSNHDHTGEDSVSYYRVFRNGEPFVDALSPVVEDTHPPAGPVVYSVQAVKFVSSPEFALLSSAPVELSVSVPSLDTERLNAAATKLTQQDFIATLNAIKTCTNAYALADGSSMCINHLGHAWPVSMTGKSETRFDHTTAVGNGLLVSVNNLEAEKGPVPALPQWSVTQLSNGQTTNRELSLQSELSPSERYRVNGVAVSVHGEVYISGTVYQSYLPRSLGPSPGVLPVTNGYYIAQVDPVTGDTVRFKRFEFDLAPGAITRISNEILEMYQTGIVSFVDTQTLKITRTLPISGALLFSDESSVYTQITDSESNRQYLKFTKR